MLPQPTYRRSMHQLTAYILTAVNLEGNMVCAFCGWKAQHHGDYSSSRHEGEQNFFACKPCTNPIFGS